MRNSDHLLLITKQHPGQYFVSLPYSPVATEKQDLLDVTYFCSKVHHRRQASDSRKLALSRLSPIYPCLRKESEINISNSYYICSVRGFPSSSADKEFTYNAGDTGLIPG